MHYLLFTVVCASLAGVSLQHELECPKAGYYRDPADCARFYRCVDLWGAGVFTAYPFVCPLGTVFDESVSVCNWPYLAAPCDGSGQGKAISGISLWAGFPVSLSNHVVFTYHPS